MERFICIHGHFYQPPRENPWLEEVELQDSAAPFHDWNERITAECYGPNAASRMLNGDGKILDIVNNYSRISFNFGPTLLSWMEQHQARRLRGDSRGRPRSAMQRFSGHGSALAQVYNHMIMPLANRATSTRRCSGASAISSAASAAIPKACGCRKPPPTSTRWRCWPNTTSSSRFSRRARRSARAGSSAAPLARGARRRRSDDRPTAASLPSGRFIVLFFYDGPISQDMAFGGLLEQRRTFRAAAC